MHIYWASFVDWFFTVKHKLHVPAGSVRKQSNFGKKELTSNETVCEIQSVAFTKGYNLGHCIQMISQTDE